MENYYLSFLMSGPKITDDELVALDISIENKDADGDRSLKIPEEKLSEYIELVKEKLDVGFWNETVGPDKVFFIFKLNDGSIKQFTLSDENEREIGKLCSKFNGDSEEKTANVYKYISGNKLYTDFMRENYSNQINRK